MFNKLLIQWFWVDVTTKPHSYVLNFFNLINARMFFPIIFLRFLWRFLWPIICKETSFDNGYCCNAKYAVMCCREYAHNWLNIWRIKTSHYFLHQMLHYFYFVPQKNYAFTYSCVEEWKKNLAQLFPTAPPGPQNLWNFLKFYL